MTGAIIGWDVGGANIKAARLTGDAPLEPRVSKTFFPLWREPERLTAVLTEIALQLGEADAMAVTMTAELADCFTTKREGVGCVLDAFAAAFPDVPVSVFCVDGQFRTARSAREQPHLVAAANWVASAMFVARHDHDVLFIDVGSTTTDVIPIIGGRIAPQGFTDPARLSSGELVYTGALRTPVSAIVRWVPLGGRRCRVAAEYFAVAADAHLWLGHIDEDGYTCETPDGRGRTRDEAGVRLARVVCADREMLTPADITAIAERIAEAQVSQIAHALRQVMRRLGDTRPAVAVLAGEGAFLAERAAVRAGLTVKRLMDGAGAMTPAVAVAAMLAAGGTGGQGR